MSEKFQTSIQFCFQCPCWQDKSNNGIGVCTDKDSIHNGQPMHSMCHCECSRQDSNPRYLIKVDDTKDGKTASLTIPQGSLTTAWITAKSLAMEYLEALQKDPGRKSVSICEKEHYIRIYGDEKQIEPRIAIAVQEKTADGIG